jgi:hypothetical protein
MKYETLKKSVASYVYNDDNSIEWAAIATRLNLTTMINEGKRVRTIELIKQIKDKVWDAIMQVDIRCIKTLIEIAPSAIPAWIKQGNYYFDLTDNGWELTKKD